MVQNCRNNLHLIFFTDNFNHALYYFCQKKKPKMRYYIVAGEASGDLHGANLIKALKEEDKHAQFRAWGGDLMSSAMSEPVVKHYRELAFMGFYEVVANLRTIFRNLRYCKEDIAAFKPDALILIDYPGFNLRIANWAKCNNIKVFYYISPQIWAWKASRVHQIARDVTRMFVILPFEKDFYAKYGYDVEFVGHPLLDAIQQGEKKPDFRSQQQLNEKPIIALLPGSRRQEIKNILPTMLKVVNDAYFSDFQFVIAAAPAIPISFYENFTHNNPHVKIVVGNTYQLLREAQAALVTSGTATLETALFRVPQVVCYRGNALSFAIAKRLVKIKYISLVNLILDSQAVVELIQNDLNVNRLKQELAKIIHPVAIRPMQLAYEQLIVKLGGGGASSNTARSIFKLLSS